MTDYITREQFKQRLGITTTTNDVRIDEHVTTASRKVDGFCHRTFGITTSAVRYFTPTDCYSVWINDAATITALAVDYADSGTYSSTWATTDYETDPANGIGPDGQSGWPTTTIRAVASLTFPTMNRRRPVKVTGTWGWAAVPDAVIEATYMFANRLYYEVSVPGGVLPPNVDFGFPGQPLQRPYTLEGLLKPYARADLSIGVAG